MSRLNRSERSWLAVLIAAGGALGGCTASKPAEPAPYPMPSSSVPSRPGAPSGVATAEAADDAASRAMDAATERATVADPGAGSKFTECVNGRPVTLGSTTESGGTSPDIPTVIARAPTPAPALSGGTLLALADGKTLVVSDPERDQVDIVDIVDIGAGQVRARVPLHIGDEPGRAVEDGAGRVHVVLRRRGELVTIDPTRGVIIAQRAICAAPRGIAFQRATDQLHVACAGGELVSVPASDGAATRTLLLDRDLRDVLVGGDGSLLVSTFRQAELLVVSADGKVATRLRPASGLVPGGVRARETEMRTPSVAWRTLALDPATNSALMLHQTGITDIVDTAPGGYGGMKDCGSIVQTGLTVLRPGESATVVSTGLGALTLAIDVALSPDHQKVAFAVAGNSPAQGPTILEESLQAALPPVPPVACRESVNDIVWPMPKGQVVAVAYAPSGTLFAQTREPAAIWRADTGTSIALAVDSHADTGLTIFHANTGAGIACASCHPEGGEDGRVWNFICVGGRRTQSLRGGIGATAPFHWDGSEIDFGFLVDDVFGGRMVGPFLEDAQKQALASWVEGIPALPVATGVDGSAIARGKALFEDATVACAGCHGGPLLTTNATVDVGTGALFQVPSLRGVSWRAPFMHDGCASTLEQRFTSTSCSGGDKHGKTSALSASQTGDLVTYLRSL